MPSDSSSDFLCVVSKGGMPSDTPSAPLCANEMP
jgi:hypothetical protein